MIVYSEMIFNRTIEDVNSAKAILNELKNGGYFPGLSTKEVETLERGTLTLNTLNRIESKISELKSIFDDMGYFAGELTTITWDVNGVFTAEDFQRILNNINALREAYYVYSDTPNTPNPRYHFRNINDIEKILVDLERMIDNVALYSLECGNAFCG